MTDLAQKTTIGAVWEKNVKPIIPSVTILSNSDGKWQIVGILSLKTRTNSKLC